MNRTLVILSLIVISVALSISVYAYTSGTSNLNITYKIASPITLADGTVLQYTPECLAECYLPIEISYAGSLSPSTKSIQLTDLTTSKNKITGTDNLQSISYMYVSNDSYIESKWVQVIECVNTTQINLTVTTECYDNGYYKNTTKYGYFLKPLTSLTLQKAQPFILVLKGNMKPSINKTSLDIVPSLYGFTMPELAWWNASWSSRKPYYIHENNNVARTNGTYDLTIDTASLISGGLLQSACQDIRITKDDTLIPQVMITNCNNAATNVIFNASIAASANQTFYFYYGNPTAPSVNTTVKLIHAETSMTIARHDFLNVYATDEDYIYIADDTIRSAHFFQYDRSSGTETAKADMPETVDGSWSGWYNSTVCYACGDLGSGIESAKFACYDNTLNVWYTYSNSFNSKRQGQGHGVYGTLFCTAAGYDGGNTLRVECYDSSTGTIKQYASLKETWGMAHTAAVSKYLFVFAHKGIQRVDLVANTTVYMANQTYNADSSPQMAECVVNNNDVVCYMFGGAASSSAVSTIQFFNNTANTTVNVAETMITPRGQGGIVVINDRIWLLAGYTNAWPTNTKLVESFGIMNYNVTILAGSETLPTSTQVYLNGGTSNLSLTYPAAINASAIINTTGIWVAIQKNGTIIANGTTSTWNNTIWSSGAYNFTGFFSGNETYSGSSSTLYATISQSTPTCTLGLSPSSPINYETNTTATCSCNNTDTGVTIKLYRNNTDITSVNNTAYSLAADTYNFVCNSTLTTNYSAASTNSNYVVNKKNAAVTISPSNSTITYNASTTQYCIDSSSFYVCILWRNNTLLSNNTNIILAADYYMFVSNITDTANYTNYQTVNYLNVSKGTPTLTINFTPSNIVTAGTIVNISCSISTTQASASLYNNSSSMSNPFTLDTTGLLGGYNYICNNSAVANYTVGSGSGTLTVTVGSGLAVNVFNEENTSQALAFNITVNNGTFSNTAYNQNNPYANNSILGLITIDITSSGYLPRTYYTSVTAGNTTTVNAYLLSAASGSSVLFYTYTVGEIPIPQALINVERLVPPSSYLTIAQKRTDTSGSASIYLSPTTTYRINVSATGYSTISSTLQPSASPYVFYMSEGAFNITYDTMFKNIWLEVKPDDAAIIFNQTYPFFYYLNSSDASLEFFGWKLTSTNGTILVTNNTSTATGGNLTYSLNTLAGYMNETYTLNYWFKKDGFSLFNMTNYYYVYEVEYANTSIYAELMDLKADASQVSEQQFAFISVLISIICMAAASSQFKMFGSGMIGIGVMALFTSMGIIIFGTTYVLGWYLIGLFLLGVIAAIMIRGGFG